MQVLILIIHVFVAVCLIALVLMQHGKGADAGAAFGSGASNTMFGSVGSLPFLIKITGLLAAIFFATSLALSFLANPHGQVSNTIGSGADAVPAVNLPSSGVPTEQSQPSK